MPLASCRYSECDKARNCYRFMGEIENSTTLEFQNICNQITDFKWFEDIDGRPLRKEEIEGGL